MADFNKYAPTLLQFEGGYVYHPSDKGGPTMSGVTLETYRKFYGRDKTVEDLKRISKEEWRTIMKDGYWDKCKADSIVSQSIAEIMVDWCVNSGLVGIRKVQEIAGVKPDGIVGPMTLNAINNSNYPELFDRIWKARQQFYINIVKRSPSQRVFMNGWMNRLNSFNFES